MAACSSVDVREIVEAVKLWDNGRLWFGIYVRERVEAVKLRDNGRF